MRILFLFICLSFSDLVISQQLFYCDSLIEEGLLSCSSKYFFNPINSQKDSLIVDWITIDYEIGIEVLEVLAPVVGEVETRIIVDNNDLGEYEVMYNGKKIVSGETQNGVPNGEFRSYTIKGRLKGVSPYQGGKLNGLQVLIDEDQDSTFRTFKMGILNGDFIIKGSNGSFHYSRFENGERIGVSYSLYDNGRLEEHFFYEKPGLLIDGYHYIYDGDGNVSIRTKVRRNKVRTIEYLEEDGTVWKKLKMKK